MICLIRADRPDGQCTVCGVAVKHDEEILHNNVTDSMTHTGCWDMRSAVVDTRVTDENGRHVPVSPTALVVRYRHQYESTVHVATVAVECEGRVSMCMISIDTDGSLTVEDNISRKKRVVPLKTSTLDKVSDAIRSLFKASTRGDA